MSKEKIDATEIIFYVHGHAVDVNPALGYVHGALTPMGRGKSVLSIERDENTGKVRIRIDRK